MNTHTSNNNYPKVFIYIDLNSLEQVFIGARLLKASLGPS